jgi:CheY-like chemotaxis protein
MNAVVQQNSHAGRNALCNSSQPATERAKTILVVDDRPAVCDVAATILNHFGYCTRTATSGEQAKSIARETPVIDLLLTDLEMPGMRRDELAEWLPMTCPKTPVIFMTKAPVTSRFRGSCRFVDNPFIHLDLFLKTIREALDHRGEDIAEVFLAA